MSKMELAARGLDLATRSIDLLTTVYGVTNPPNTVSRVATEIGRWLGRERLNEHELQFCLEKTYGLVTPNQKACSFYESVLSGVQKRVVGPLFVQPSGALGRLMAVDPNQCWITSTIACLYEFYSEEFISDALCSFILQSRRSEKGQPLSQHQLSWHADRIQIKPVIDKIISSVWLNVVNSGVINTGIQGSLQPPNEIQSICARGHHLGSYAFGTVLDKIRTAGAQIIFESKCILSNLVLWLMYHFNGRLRVVVNGEILYNRELGGENRAIEFRIQGDCHQNHQVGYIMYTEISGNLNKLFAGRGESSFFNSEPKVRQQLYHTSIKYPSGASNKDSIKSLTRTTALELFTWLLKLPILLIAFPGSLEYCVEPNERDSGRRSKFQVADLFARIPTMPNLGWGEYSGAKVIFEVPVENETDSSSSSEDDTGRYSIAGDVEDTSDLRLISHYPIIKDLLNEVKKSCRCIPCKTSVGEASSYELQPGCLQHTSFFESHDVYSSWYSGWIRCSRCFRGFKYEAP